MENEKIRKHVRETYKNVATQGKFESQPQPSACCNTGDTSCGCGNTDMDMDQVSAILGYSQEELESAPEGANLGLGCGNPQTIADAKEGETVVDLGSGGGFDCFLAAKKVGDSGKIIGVDMTPEMIERARMNKEKVDAENVEFRLGEIEHLPVKDNSVNLIISNCVINLSPEKQQVYHDAFRILKPGGRIAVSDIVAVKELTKEMKQDLSLVSACMGGAATIKETRIMLENAGFEQIRILPRKVSQDLVDEWLPGSNIGEYVASGYIQAIKPVQ